MAEIVGPADVVTPVVLFLKQLGFQAAAVAPESKPPKTVRVSRTGGGPVNEVQDVAEVLIEAWELDTNRGWDLAIDMWKAFAGISKDDQHALPGLTTFEVVPTVPLQHQDPFTEDLIRYQFTLSLRYRMVPL